MTSGFAEERQGSFTGEPSGSVGLPDGERLNAKLKVGPGGRVLIPANMRERLGVVEGDALMASLEGGELRLITLAESVRRAQAIVRSRVPAGVSLVDELLADRRREVQAERGNG